MNISRHGHHFSAYTFYAALIAILTIALLAACSPQDQAEPPETSPTAEPTSIPTATSTQVPSPTPTVTPRPTTIPPDWTTLPFEEGRYERDEICSRMFNYHQIVDGTLTIVIADNIIGLQAPQELVTDVAALYNQLADNSRLTMDQEITVYVIDAPGVGGCYSRDGLVFVSPDALDAPTFREELLGAAAGVDEYWVLSGLASLAVGEQPDDDLLKDWYENTDDLVMAGLFAARFKADWATEEEQEIARMSAASLVQYAREVAYIAPDKLAERVNNEVRTRWLASLGVDRAVTYPYDGHFAGFLYYQTDLCSLFVQADTMQFCLNSAYFNDIAEVEFLIDQAYYGRRALAEYLMAEAPSVSEKMDPEAMITITVLEENAPLGYFMRRENSTLYINASAMPGLVLPPLVHTFKWNPSMDQTWLIFGFAEYLGKYLPIFTQPEKACIFNELNGGVYSGEDADIEPGTSACHFLDPEQLAAAKAWYLAQGGGMETAADIDPRLYADAVSFATLYRDALGGLRGATIADKFSALNPALTGEGQDGVELSFTQAASLLAYLCDTYSIDRVLEVYVNGAEDGSLDGKTYAELKAEWQANLMEKGAEIAIPGQP